MPAAAAAAALAERSSSAALSRFHASRPSSADQSCTADSTSSACCRACNRRILTSWSAYQLLG